MISAVVVNHNGEPFLERCLGSLLASSPPPDEVLVVDNESTDGSAALVASRFPPERFPHVRWVEAGANRGFGAAANLGAREAAGSFLLILNPDVWLEPSCLARLAARLEAEPRLGLVGPRLVYPDGRPQTFWSPEVSVAGEALQKLRNRLEPRTWNHGRALARLLGPVWLTGACLLVRRTAFEAIGGFDEGFFLYFEDADLGQRLRRAGWRLAWEDAAVATHVKGGTGAPTHRSAYRAAQQRYYAKHRPKLEQRLLAWWLG